MSDVNKKINKLWAKLLNQNSRTYLLRSEIDQCLAVTSSNLSASFMGNRQLANHNTTDIKYCLSTIANSNPQKKEFDNENIELAFLKHQSRLNKRLAENSKLLLLAIEQLQDAHKRVMKTNEEIIKFNNEMINATSEIISTDTLDEDLSLDKKSLEDELEKIDKNHTSSCSLITKLISQVRCLTQNNQKASEELLKKRDRIINNRKHISGVRSDLSIWVGKT